MVAVVNLNERIERGKKAIALAKKKGLDTFRWEKEIVKLELARAQEVARRTCELLDNRGWCLWRCKNLNDDIVVVCRDEDSRGYPNGYPVYIEYELDIVGRDDLNHDSLRLVHEAKKLTGARVTTEYDDE
jgi:hypothetical protein